MADDPEGGARYAVSTPTKPDKGSVHERHTPDAKPSRKQTIDAPIGGGAAQASIRGGAAQASIDVPAQIASNTTSPIPTTMTPKREAFLCLAPQAKREKCAAPIGAPPRLHIQPSDQDDMLAPIALRSAASHDAGGAPPSW